MSSSWTKTSVQDKIHDHFNYVLIRQKFQQLVDKITELQIKIKTKKSFLLNNKKKFFSKKLVINFWEAAVAKSSKKRILLEL